MSRLKKICIGLKQYLANCNLHGIRYLVEDDLHWTERLFWLITCALCWFGCFVMVKDSIDGFYYRPVAFTAESTYLDWKTNFPSVSICLRAHPDAMDIAGSLYKKKYGSAIKAPHAWSWLFSSTISKGNSKTTAQLSQLTSEDVVHIYKESTINCTALLSECFWRGNLKFNCCDEFFPLKTAAGLCYVFNSIHTQASTFSKEFSMDQKSGVGYLSIGLTAFTFFGLQSAVVVHIHNNLAIPTDAGDNGKEIDTSKDKINTVYFTLEDTFNDPGLRHVSPVKRRCRFPDETENFYIYKWYSNSGCLIQLQIENMLRVCGCVSHLFPYTIGTPVCNYTSEWCIFKNKNIIMAKEDSSKRCLPDCEGTVMRHFQNIKASPSNSSVFRISQGIHLELLALPTSRYKRYVVRSLLDLVVAVGSTAGLFMGAGILSLVEIPYWLLLRHGS